MQEVNERRQRRRSDDAIDDGQDVTETVLMLSHATLRQRSMPESWVRFAMDKLWSLVFLTVASLGLYEAQFVSEIVHAPHANRNFVHLGILFGTLLAVFGGYIEVYRSVFLGEHVKYESVKTATHGMLASMLASGLWYVLIGRIRCCICLGYFIVWIFDLTLLGLLLFTV